MSDKGHIEVQKHKIYAGSHPKDANSRSSAMMPSYKAKKRPRPASAKSSQHHHRAVRAVHGYRAVEKKHPQLQELASMSAWATEEIKKRQICTETHLNNVIHQVTYV
jgi:hypothetical protein